ncbi:MAG: tRNA epoxyqueuosine(34) reductase QueG [Silvanigrellaceae bacterium]|nr:tRNA epoxyqueuosine(34) reductase QueG [Silvanigrellaceae bacterium]
MNQFVLKKEILSILSHHEIIFSGIFDYQNHFSQLDKDIVFYKNWINDGHQGEMEYLAKNLTIREDARKLFPELKSALIFLFPYHEGNRTRKQIRRDEDFNNKIEDLSLKDSIVHSGLISRYARGKDYHKVLKKRLHAVAQELVKHIENPFIFKPIIDSVPFLDRAHGREAGLGFVGKNTMLIRPGLGSYFFIASLLTSLPASEFAQESKKHNPIYSLDCGSCQRCLDACPTSAFVEPFKLDAKKCLSYLTIEHRDIVDEVYLPHYSSTIYGCDICQTVCPYNFVTDDLPKLKQLREPHEPFLNIKALDIAQMSKQEYESWFGGTAATRAKYSGLVRNALYHLYAVQDQQLPFVLALREKDENQLIRKVVEQLNKLIKHT